MPRPLPTIYAGVVNAFRALSRPFTPCDPRARTLTKAAVRAAALCLDQNGHLHPHQYRIRRGLLSEAERRLQAQRKQLRGCEDFGALFKLVCDVVGPIKGIGRHGVTPYDIAVQIGACLGLTPKYIYLHNGTLEGARALGLRGRKLSRDQLPPEFWTLEPGELEDCLCLFKDDLRAIALAANQRAVRVHPLRRAGGCRSVSRRRVGTQPLAPATQARLVARLRTLLAAGFGHLN